MAPKLVVRCEARNHLQDLPVFANLVIADLLSEVAHLEERIKQAAMTTTPPSAGLHPAVRSRAAVGEAVSSTA